MVGEFACDDLIRDTLLVTVGLIWINKKTRHQIYPPDSVQQRATAIESHNMVLISN
jgi:hypothetical protein